MEGVERLTVSRRPGEGRGPATWMQRKALGPGLRRDDDQMYSTKTTSTRFAEPEHELIRMAAYR
ncbi:hypothetical protein GCM10011408_29310 [Dyella caseinilytica]|nr:hypothetical protein GCM10011408_29310 [Dyella caseinilytica]